MQKIMFEQERLGLEQAVLDLQKTMTRRKVNTPPDMTYDFWNPVMGIDNKGKVYFTVDYCDGSRRDIYPQYQIGEVVAIAQRYKDIPLKTLMKQRTDGNTDRWLFEDLVKQSKGYNNKMFVRADLMPHHVKITNIKVERMHDISDEDCRKEGIVDVTWRQYPEPFSDRYVDYNLWTLPKFRESVNNSFGEKDKDEFLAESPKVAFYVIIRKLMGQKTWNNNPWVFVYEFKIVK